MDIKKQDDSKAIDLSHHLSKLSNARSLSPLKGLQKYFSSDVLPLAGGMPSPAYFPVSSITINALSPESFSVDPTKGSSSFSWLWKLFSTATSKERTDSITIPKYANVVGEIDLATFLQYGPAVARPPMQEFICHFVSEVYQPAISDFAVLIDTGNTDGWSRAVLTLCNPGEGVLCEEWTYPSALAGMVPHNIKPVPIAIDSHGMRSDDLERVLSEWDEDARGMPRPHVLYIIPIGQNPTGCNMGVERKQEIYEICVKYDVIIVEDDPYYFLQFDEYVSKQQRSLASQSDDAKHFVSSLIPSFLRFDRDGRVIRLDSFSKTIAPGSRLGWFTCNPMFAERLERHGETSAGAPCGFGQAIAAKILQHWTYDGYIRWLRGLRVDYQRRRDFFIDCLVEEFHLKSGPPTTPFWSGCTTYHALFQPRSEKMYEIHPLESCTMFSFAAPAGGMFVWMKLHFNHHPAFVPENEQTLEVELWSRLADNGVLFAPGWMFSVVSAATGEPVENDSGHFRISFSIR